MKNAGTNPASFLRLAPCQGRLPTADPDEVLLLPGGTGVDAPGPEPMAVPLPRPPSVPTPGCAEALLPPAARPLLPVVPGTASPPEDPECGAEPAMPDGPPGGPSGTAGRTTSAALPVPGLPGAFGFTSARSLHAPSRAAAAIVPAMDQDGLRITRPYCVVVVALGVLDEPEVLMSVLEPVVPVAEPEAPMEVPLPVVPAPMSVLPVVPVPAVVEPELMSVLLPVVPAVELVSADGVVVDGTVDEVEDSGTTVVFSSRLPQAVRVRAAVMARAALSAIGDLIIQELLESGFEVALRDDSVPAACGSL